MNHIMTAVPDLQFVKSTSNCRHHLSNWPVSQECKSKTTVGDFLPDLISHLCTD